MLVVAVLRGGPSEEHAISLKTGAEVISRLDRAPYRAIDVFIDKQGVWHVRGIPMSPARALSSVDVVFNALHGAYGEDGTVQKLLSRLGVPFTGSGAYGAALAHNKVLTKLMLEKLGIRTPRHALLRVTPDLMQEALKAYRMFSPPVIVKPTSSGSSLGMTLAKGFEEFWEGVKSAFNSSTEVMVEEFIPGRDATAGIIEGMRASPYYQMLPVEIHVPTWKAVDFDAKYGGKTDFVAPGNFSKEESNELQRLSRAVHEELGLQHYSRSDFVVSPYGIYFLEVNSLPTITPESSFVKSLSAVGISTDELLDHVIGLALKRK